MKNSFKFIIGHEIRSYVRAKKNNVFLLLPEIPALDVNATNGQRVVFSPLDPRALRKRVGGNDHEKNSTIARLERFARDTPLLGRSPRKAQNGEQSLLDDEWFDVKAGIVGEKLELVWGKPERLCVYLIPQGG